MTLGQPLHSWIEESLFNVSAAAQEFESQMINHERAGDVRSSGGEESMSLPCFVFLSIVTNNLHNVGLIVQLSGGRKIILSKSGSSWTQFFVSGYSSI